MSFKVMRFCGRDIKFNKRLSGWQVTRPDGKPYTGIISTRREALRIVAHWAEPLIIPSLPITKEIISRVWKIRRKQGFKCRRAIVFVEY